MATMFRLTKNSILPPAKAKIIKAKDYSQMLEANAILEEAQTRAANIIKEAELAYQERKNEGYEDGLLEGRMAQAEKMLEVADQAIEYIEKLENTLVGVVSTALRKIIGEMDEKERIVKVVRNALVSVRSQQRVSIRVCPADEVTVRESLAAMLASSPGSVNLLDVVADPRMQQGDCILESELGVVNASLEQQISAIERALLGKIREN